MGEGRNAHSKARRNQAKAPKKMVLSAMRSSFHGPHIVEDLSDEEAISSKVLAVYWPPKVEVGPRRKR
jgi:hypothetical protein